MRIGTRLATLVVPAALAAVFLAGQAQDPKPSIAQPSEIDEQREALLRKLNGAIPVPRDVLSAATEMLGRPIEDQELEALRTQAAECNKAANFIDMIVEQYRDYARENYRYDFVVKGVNNAKSEMDTMRNALMAQRNQLYFNIGEKLVQSGNRLEGFLAFRDAFRLSAFEGKGMRLRAEIEMKKILGIEDLKSYTTFEEWSK